MTTIAILYLIGAFVLGLGVGGAYFGSIWWGAEQFASRNRLPATITLMMGRFVLMAVVLAQVAMHGGAVLLPAVTLGIAIARSAVMRRVKAITP